MLQCLGKTAASSCPLTQETLKFHLAQVVKTFLFPSRKVSLSLGNKMPQYFLLNGNSKTLGEHFHIDSKVVLLSLVSI